MLVYGTGLAAFANSLGFDIDLDKYNQALFFIRSKNVKPWELTTYEDFISHYLMELDASMLEAIKYYFSDECKKVIEEARAVKENYFSQFPKIQQFIKNAIEVTKRRGWIKTWTGRRRHFHNPKAEAYKAPNALIQGG